MKIHYENTFKNNKNKFKHNFTKIHSNISYKNTFTASNINYFLWSNKLKYTQSSTATTI